jgi:preprotein translocase subunit SecB
MNEENQNTASEDGGDKIVRTHKIYLKDASFESPHAPEIFSREWKPSLDVEIDSHAQQIADNTYDVVMKVTAKVTTEENTAFLAEVHQAGIFELKGFESDRLQQLQNVYCLKTLYPYASAALADLVTKGGFPSLILAPMNFAAIYNQRLQQQNESRGDETVTRQQ